MGYAYKSMKQLWDDLTHLEAVKPVPYEPEAPTKISQGGRTAITATLIIIAICLLIIAFGFLVQMAHHAAH